MPRKPPPSAPYLPTDWEIADASAIQALMEGEATPEQQKRALQWVIEKCAATYDLSYRPESQRDSDFAEGKRFVGLQLVKMLKINIAALRQAKNKQ